MDLLSITTIAHYHIQNDFRISLEAVVLSGRIAVINQATPQIQVVFLFKNITKLSLITLDSNLQALAFLNATWFFIVYYNLTKMIHLAHYVQNKEV